MNQRYLILVAAEDREAANAYAASVLGLAGEHGVFLRGLSPSGDLPATHYWCSVQLHGVNTEELGLRVAGLAVGCPSAVSAAYDLLEDRGFPERFRVERGLEVVSRERALWA